MVWVEFSHTWSHAQQGQLVTLIWKGEGFALLSASCCPDYLYLFLCAWGGTCVCSRIGSSPPSCAPSPPHPVCLLCTRIITR
jgi:hypothetical protein